MRGVTVGTIDDVIAKAISTHTPHARRDHYVREFQALTEDFYSHASCEA